MDDLVLVEVVDGGEYLSHDLGCLNLCHEHAVVDVVVNLTEQVATLAQLRNDEETFAVLKDLLETENVGMVAVLQKHDHGHELVHRVLVHQLFFEDTDGSLVLGSGVLADAHLTVGSLPNQLPNPVVLKEGVWPLKHSSSLLTFERVEHGLEPLILIGLLLFLLAQSFLWLNYVGIDAVRFAIKSSHRCL